MLQVLLHNLRESPSYTYRDKYIARNDAEGYCMVICLSNLEGVADEIIQREIKHFQDLERGFEWCLFSTDLPSDMLQRLQVKGFDIKAKEAICMFNLEDPFEVNDESIRVERVRTPRHLHDFQLVAEEVFNKDFSFTTSILAKAIEVGSTIETGFVAYDQDTPVSIGRLFRRDHAPCGALYTGATREPWRGKGYYRAVIHARVEFARKSLNPGLAFGTSILKVKKNR
jgi:hypothetical protein